MPFLYIPADLTEIYPHMKYQRATKTLNLDTLVKVQSQWTVKYRSWGHGSCIFLLVSQRYILIWNINLLPLICLEILPWTKILTWSSDDGCTYGWPECSMPPAGRGCGGHNKSNQTKFSFYYFFLLLAMISVKFEINKPRHDKTWLRKFPTRPDTNRPAQPQKLARVLTFRL